MIAEVALMIILCKLHNNDFEEFKTLFDIINKDEKILTRFINDKLIAHLMLIEHYIYILDNIQEKYLINFLNTIKPEALQKYTHKLTKRKDKIESILVLNILSKNKIESCKDCQYYRTPWCNSCERG